MTRAGVPNIFRFDVQPWYPIITKPTKISNVSATLSDNIFTNDINSDIPIGLLIADINDHSIVFAICKSDGDIFDFSRPVRSI